MFSHIDNFSGTGFNIYFLLFQFGQTWLREKIKECFNKASIAVATDDVCESVTALLVSERTNDELQNEAGLSFSHVL